MKKVILCFLIIIFVGLLFVPQIYIYQNSKELDIAFEETLNGFPQKSDINRYAQSFCTKYLNDNFVDDEEYIVLFNGVKDFNMFLSKAKEINRILDEDPFCNIEDVYPEYFDILNKYYAFYSEEYIEDSRVFVSNDAFCIKIKDLNFDNNEFEEVHSGNFVITVFKKDIKGETYGKRQSESPYSSLGFEKCKNDVIFSYVDTRTNEITEILVKFSIFNIESISFK